MTAMQLMLTWPFRMWGCSLKEARYYGWRVWLNIGPAHLLIGKCKP